MVYLSLWKMMEGVKVSWDDFVFFPFPYASHISIYRYDISIYDGKFIKFHGSSHHQSELKSVEWNHGWSTGKRPPGRPTNLSHKSNLGWWRCPSLVDSIYIYINIWYVYSIIFIYIYIYNDYMINIYIYIMIIIDYICIYIYRYCMCLYMIT